jgi:hypothetical protein
MVDLRDVMPAPPRIASGSHIPSALQEETVYVIVQHQILDPEVAFPRGQALIAGDGAPDGTRVVQCYPHVDGSAVTCLWETASVGDIQRFADAVLGDASVNTCYQVDVEKAFADHPLGLASSPAALH